MSESKAADIITILDSSYRECHEIIMSVLKDDLNTLYSCIRVNRSFCRIFIPILWKNPFKFVKDDDKLIKIFNTLIHCLDPTNKSYLTFKGSIEIKDLPTPKAYFNYHTLIREFELNPLQRGMRLWTSKYLDDQSRMSSGKRVSKRVVVINKYIGELFFSNRNRYDSLNIYYNDLLSGPSSLLDISEFKNYEESLVNVNRLSLGFFHRNNTDLIAIITRNFLKLQNILSTNIQHLEISITTNKRHSVLFNNLLNFIQSQQN